MSNVIPFQLQRPVRQKTPDSLAVWAIRTGNSSDEDPRTSVPCRGDGCQTFAWRGYGGFCGWCEEGQDAVDVLGGCPECGRNDGHHNVGAGHWGLCHQHRTRWFIGANLFSGWREESEAEQRAQFAAVADYAKVEARWSA